MWANLFTEVRDDVPKLASELKKVQEPKLIGMEDFSIGQIKDGTALKLPTAKKNHYQIVFFQ
jgi:hypothetical protein